MYSAHSAHTQGSNFSRINAPLPPLPADPSPYEAAARAHAARLGLSSSLNPNVLTVLPEMSVHDSNQLYLPQRHNSRKFGSSSSELGARGNASPKRSGSLFSVKRYSRPASDAGHGPREYASFDAPRGAMSPVPTLDRRHSLNPGSRSSYDSRQDEYQDAQEPPMNLQPYQASQGSEYRPPSQASKRISLDTPDMNPLNNYPVMESNGYDQTRSNGYT